MEGAALAAKRKHETGLIQAWHIAAFSTAAQNGKLKKLDHYLARPPKAQSASEMLAIMKEFKTRGAGMTFKKVN